VDGFCNTHGKGEEYMRGFMGKLEGKRALGVSTRSWEDDIKTDLREIKLGVTDWINLAQDMEVSCGQSNEVFVSVQIYDVLDYLNNWWLLK
jgi:uncharacterized protein YebE (UPF0316 family)